MKQCTALNLSHSLNTPVPFYVLYGPETFLIEESRLQIQNHLCQKNVFERIRVELDNPHTTTALTNPSLALLGEQQLIELSIPPAFSTHNTLLKNAFTLATPQTTFIIQLDMSSAVKRAAWFEPLAQHGLFVGHWPLSRTDFVRWIKQRANAKGLVLENADCHAFMEFTQGNCLNAAQEIDRLALLGSKPIVIEWAQHSQFTLSELLHAILKNQPNEVIKVICYLKSTAPCQLSLVLWALGQLLRSFLAGLSEPTSTQKEIFSRSGLQQNLLLGYLSHIGNASEAACLAWLGRLAKADEQLKSSESGLAWQGALEVGLGLAQLHPALSS